MEEGFSGLSQEGFTTLDDTQFYSEATSLIQEQGMEKQALIVLFGNLT